MGQIELIRLNLGRPELLRRCAKMAGEPDDLFDVGTLRVRCQVADLHVFDHATAKWAHRQLLCEMNSATWRRRMVSQPGCQARGGRYAAPFRCSRPSWNYVDPVKELPRS